MAFKAPGPSRQCGFNGVCIHKQVNCDVCFRSESFFDNLYKNKWYKCLERHLRRAG